MLYYNGDGVAFHLFGLEIRWYAILIVTGMVIASYLLYKETIRRGMNEELSTDLTIYLLISGVIGARLWYVIFEWGRFKDNPLSVFNLRTGGLAIQGGIMGALLVGYFYCRRRHYSFLRMTDLVFPLVSLGQAIGRWGNFTNNEAYGGPTDLPWALLINGQKVHPTFLYESLGDLAIFFFLWWYSRKKLKVDGELSCLYLILYGLLRFFVEGLRTDSLWWGNIRVAQLLSVLGILAGAVGLYLASKQEPNAHIPGENPRLTLKSWKEAGIDPHSYDSIKN